MVVLGTCSICGGRVLTPAVWYSVIPPTPHCECCGATPAFHGPVIPMRPRTAPLDLTGVVPGKFNTASAPGPAQSTTATPTPSTVAEILGENKA